MYPKILVPLDGSTRAERILSHVEKLAHINDSLVIFLQIVQPDVIGDGYRAVLVELNRQAVEQKIAEAEGYLGRIAGLFREKGINSRTIIEVGSVVSGIVRIARREAVDLLALASHGRSGMSRVFYGSVAAGLLQQIDRPLLLIRSRQD